MTPSTGYEAILHASLERDLARYLAEAALDDRLPDAARSTARALVAATAESLWAGAELRAEPGRGRRGGTCLTFPQKPVETASDAYPPGSRVELSTQLQAWMAFEGAHRLAQGD